MLSAIQKCKENGGKVIAVNPLPEAGLLKYTDPQSVKRMVTNGINITDLFLPVRINGDVAFLKALMTALEMDESKGGVIDHHFIKDATFEYDEFLAGSKQNWIFKLFRAIWPF